MATLPRCCSSARATSSTPINLGATANHDGADQVGGKDSSVFLDAAQKADVNQLLDMGIKLYVQQTPTYQSVDIDAKL